MKLSGNFLGHEIWNLTLDISLDGIAQDVAATALDKSIKGVTRWWTKRMSR